MDLVTHVASKYHPPSTTGWWAAVPSSPYRLLQRAEESSSESSYQAEKSGPEDLSCGNAQEGAGDAGMEPPRAAAVCGRQPGHVTFGCAEDSPLSRGSFSTLNFYLARGGGADTLTARLSWPQSQLRYMKVIILAERGTVPPLTPCFASHKKFFKRGSRCRALAFNLLLWDWICVSWGGGFLNWKDKQQNSPAIHRKCWKKGNCWPVCCWNSWLFCSNSLISVSFQLFKSQTICSLKP